ncbi:MAG: hypothetical protein WA208_16755 [Thermoanaerobaculia bacterium]
MPERTTSRAVGLKARGAELANHLKSRSTETVDTLKHEMRTRAGLLKREMAKRRERTKRSMARVQVSARENVALQRNRMNDSMRTEPMKWAGIAAGSGLVLGLLGRYAHWRSTRPTPQVVVIESCS